jgi:hypothetical protein
MLKSCERKKGDDKWPQMNTDKERKRLASLASSVAGKSDDERCHGQPVFVAASASAFRCAA